MRALLEYLGTQVHTLTVYDFTGTDDQLDVLGELLHGYGVTLETVDTGGAGPGDVAVLHSDGSVLGATHVDPILEWTAFERGFDTEMPDSPPLLSKLSTDVAVKPALTVDEMVRISRDFERRALRQSGGELHAGFQQLSQIKASDRTVQMYTALAENGVDVTVYGLPDVHLDDVPFTVVEDEDGEFQQHWFLLYDGDGNPDRKATLVSEECLNEAGHVVTDVDHTEGGAYDSYVTTDPETVDELFSLANEEYDLLRLTE